MCYFHVVKNVEKYLKGNSKLKADLDALQVAKDQATFQVAAALFLKNWQTVNPEFAKYFEDQWISKNANWFEGATPGKPSTNNGLEGTNAIIKSQHTLRERLPVGKFLHSAVDVVEAWSNKRNPVSVDCVHFARTHAPTLPE